MHPHARDNQDSDRNERPRRSDAPRPEQEVTLLKDGHRWRLVCAAGEEPELLEAVSELADADDIDFDWFDAALVAHELKRRVHASLASFTGPISTPKQQRGSPRP